MDTMENGDMANTGQFTFIQYARLQDYNVIKCSSIVHIL